MPSVGVATRGPRPPIRVRPAPRWDPPYDDELDPDSWVSVHQLAFQFPPLPSRTGSGPPGSGDAALPGFGTPGAGSAGAGSAGAGSSGSGSVGSPASGCVGSPGSGCVGSPGSGCVGSPGSGGAGSPGPPGSGQPAASPTPRLAGASDDAAWAVRRFVRVFLEVLNGYRPAAHLRGLSLPKEAPSVVTQAVAATCRVAELRRARPGWRASDRRGRGAKPVATIGTHLCEPRPGAVEASVLLVTGERTWAMALRLERHDQTWCATTLRLV